MVYDHRKFLVTCKAKINKSDVNIYPFKGLVQDLGGDFVLVRTWEDDHDPDFSYLLDKDGMNDREGYDALMRNEWQYLGLVVEIFFRGECVAHDSLWGIESRNDGNIAYFDDIIGDVTRTAFFDLHEAWHYHVEELLERVAEMQAAGLPEYQEVK